MHLFPEARPDPATHAPASFRKEGRFASSSVEGKDGKKCDKEVFKTPELQRSIDSKRLVGSVTVNGTSDWLW